MNDGLLRSAFALQQAGNLAEGARLYGEAARANPRNFDAPCLLGMAQAQLGQGSEAQHTTDQALARFTRNLEKGLCRDVEARRTRGSAGTLRGIIGVVIR
jgi:hypothetical protein